MATAIDFTYQYQFASNVHSGNSGPELQLATCGAHLEKPHFFNGLLVKPRVTAQMLLVLSDVVGTHFFKPLPPLLDPVVTSSEAMLRFEGFSGCCGVYARVDLPEAAIDASYQKRGTTNVDFNNPMKQALLRLRDQTRTELAVGADSVSLSSDKDQIIEKKVKLPLRWVKGFSEVQAYQPSMQLKIEAEGASALQFVRSLPRANAAKSRLYLEKSGRNLRSSSRAKPSSVGFAGSHRIKVLEPLMISAKKLRVWEDEESGTTLWEIITDAGKFSLMISPDVYRGFSGEGQQLKNLSSASRDSALNSVKAQLNWQSHINIADIATQTGKASHEIIEALAVLGTRGLAGYDIESQSYFHRELPFDLELVDDMQPRLKAAHKLIQNEKVQSYKNNSKVFLVTGTDVDHRVELTEENNSCTCPWFSRYQGQRGPCKHILSAQIFRENQA